MWRETTRFTRLRAMTLLERVRPLRVQFRNRPTAPPLPETERRFRLCPQPSGVPMGGSNESPFLSPDFKKCHAGRGYTGPAGLSGVAQLPTYSGIPVFHFTPVQKGLRRRSAAAVALVYGMAIGLFSAKTWAGLTSAAAAPFGHLLGFNGQ